ncbi:MAG: DUF4136 domain-containing protein [Proteobacteria bacterium]|nr:DUF4136 domain-containing protein [Pseudomonadota bacterium]
MTGFQENSMIRRMAVVGAGALVLLAGCATHWDVDSFEAPRATWPPGTRTSGRAVISARQGTHDPAVVASASAQLRGAVTAELNRKGFKEVDTAAAADMIVSFQVAGTQRFVPSDERRIGAPSATTVLRPSEIQPPPASTVPRERRIREGSVLVFIDDRASGQLIWRGMVTEETRGGSTEQGVRQLTQMAHEIAREVPARTGAQK